MTEKVENILNKVQMKLKKILYKKSLKKVTLFFNENNRKIYIFGLLLYLITVIVSNYTILGNVIPNICFTIVKYIGLLIVAFKILIYDITGYGCKDFLRVIFSFLLIFIIVLSSKNMTLLHYFILILGIKDIPFRKVVKAVLIAEVIVTVIIISLACTGIIENRIYGRTNESAKRYSLGFKDCKYPAIFVWSITILYIYLKNKKITKKDIISLLLLNIIFFILTDSKSEFICSLIAIISAPIILKIKNIKIKKAITYTAKYIMIVSFIIMLILTFFYNSHNPIMKTLDTKLSGRLNLSHRALENYGITIFGQHIKWIGLNSIYLGKAKKVEMNFVDCSYLKVMFEYGIAGITLLLTGYWKLINKKNIYNNKILLLSIIVIAIHSIFDPQLLALPMNIFLLLINSVLFEKNIKKGAT